MEQEGTSLMEPTGAAPLRPTDLREIGPYRLLGRLGEGGMGTVFLARAPTGRFVALKIVKAEFANQEGFAARFHAEVENARRVASFCTAQVLDNGNTGDGRPFMVTEYIAGTPLSEQIAKFGALDPGPLHGVGLGVAAALAAIHVAGLVHRDLKPANVILSLSGPRVIDFGIARALDRETGFTMSGELLGSPGWWAPEQVRGEAISPAVDIFAWGCLIAYAGNGRHPFGRGDPITMAHRVLNTPPDLGALPAPLNELVRLATSMEPAARPTAQDLLIALVGGNTPAPSINPPTLVATEMLNDWQPPRNVVDEPDITATFTTPPPGDAAQRGPTGAGAGAGRLSDAGQSSPSGASPGSSGRGQAAFEELARREELAAKEELARWPTPQGDGQQDGGAGPGRVRGLFKRKSGEQGPEGDSGEGDGPGIPPTGTAATISATDPPGPTPHESLGRTRQDSAGRPVQDRSGRPSGRAGEAWGLGGVPAREQLQRMAHSEQRAADTQPGDRRTAVSPEPLPNEPDTLGGDRTAGTRWLIAAAAAVLAIVVTVGVLIVTSGRGPGTSTAGGGPSQTATTSSPPNDVGRRFPLGGELDDPIAIISSAPRCGLKEYEGKVATQGQLCVIRWTMLNPGGERRTLVQPVVTLVDDRGGEHDPAAVTLPPAILPGARVDSAFVFDLATYRRPVKLTATMLENGKQIEVAL
ncbi:serine/threonine-protein kinase [Nonomuraea sp. LP-02]|uniref:serine/threonine-protein kinase n=1 Tax=Nonomuraea sp. LP-02 TaxID=3097960 RepID=UPI002E34302E|nr:serine/threonine-protein kinase [Nonomuraea sp. LP-02]MED7929613.1 serine/threonine-protein kinase [Nonomuraea sp. LP-02]